MQETDWKITLKRNRFFSILPEAEQVDLLNERSTKEREYPKGVKIFEEDDLEDKVYLIGSGVVEVYLLSKKKEKILLNKLVRGDLVGEMALLEQKRRSATVIALEDCLALEMDGQLLRDIRERYPRFASELSALADERLRQLGNAVIATGKDDIDDQIRQLELRLDAQQQTISTKLEAAQTVFDQTSRRASEIIESAERARSRLTWMTSVAGTILTLIIGISGYFGITKVEEFDEAKEEFNTVKKEVYERVADINSISLVADEAKGQIEGVKKQLVTVNEAITEFHEKYTLNEFFKALIEDPVDPVRAEKKFNSALSVSDPTLTDHLFIISGAPVLFKGNKAIRDNFRTILDKGIKGGHTRSNLQKGYSYALLLTAMILMGEDENNEYRRNLALFDDFLQQLEKQDDAALLKKEFEFSSSAIEEHYNNKEYYNKSLDDPDGVILEKIIGVWGRLHKPANN